MTRMTKTERIARERLFRNIWMAELDNPDWHRVERHVPDAWHLVAHDVDVTEKKKKVTLYLDASVAKVFRAMGKGYHARINRILATWVQMEAASLFDVRRKMGLRDHWVMDQERARMAKGEPSKGFGSGVKPDE